MRLDSLKKSTSILAVTLAVAALVSACGGTVKEVAPKKEAVQDASLRVESTEDYLPVDSFNELGQKVPYVRAINPYNSASEPINPGSIELYITARRAFKAKQYVKAKETLDQLVKQDKTLSGPWVLLGDIARLRSSFGEAVSHYKAAIAINETNTNAYLRLGLVYRQQGDFDSAHDAYTTALSIWKDFPEAHLNLAILYDLYINQPLKAQRHLEAYQFLVGKKSRKVAKWLDEIRLRTKVAYSIDAGKSVAQSNSIAGDGSK